MEKFFNASYNTAALPDRKIIFSLVTKGHSNAHILAQQQALNLEAVILSDVWFPTSVMAISASLTFLPLTT